MTTISPLNEKLISNSLNKKQEVNSKANKHDMVYKNLIAESAVIKPNKAKAVLLKENPIQAAVRSVKDFINDGKNFFKAAATGQMDDNSLGRINDFGMKFGGLLIATFLASKAKTKTSAIMQYIGGTAFFASMALWPKIFINLPAKLIHGFKIDQKYISAQGEKKDFFLDNQFLPWDAFSEDELRQNAKNAGIDYDSENGDEKIKRKMQKTALQNRTLWMATAGFATPLMTALFGDFVEPKVKDAVIKNEFKKSQKALEEINQTLSHAKPIVRNSKEIENAISQFNLGKTSYKELIDSLTESLSLDLKDVFLDSDNVKPIKNLKIAPDFETLNALRMEKSTITDANIAPLLRKAFSTRKKTDVSSELSALFGSQLQATAQTKGLSEKTIKAIAEEFKEAPSRTYNTLLTIAQKYAAENNVDADFIKSRMSKIDFQYDDTEFFNTVKKYNSEVLGGIRGRLKEYLTSFINPVMGNKDESVYTDMYRKAMKKALPKGNPKDVHKLLEAIKFPNKTMIDENGQALQQSKYIASEAMAKLYENIANIKNDEEYKKAITELFLKEDSDVAKVANAIVQDDNLKKIISLDQTSPIFESKTGKAIYRQISDNIKRFADVANQNSASIRSRVLISANLERRIVSGEFKKQLEEAKLITKETPIEELIKKARYMVYQGTVASDACAMEFKNENVYQALKNIIYDNSKFGIEKEVYSELDNILNSIKSIMAFWSPGVSSKDSAVATGLTNLEKTVATEILNNRAWKKIFVPMFGALVAVTLLVQPFFGNIKKEFPEKNEGGKH